MYLSSQYSQSQASEESCLLSERQRSSRFSLNEQPTYGIYNRNDFMARCYRSCWKKNSRIGPELKKLLCFGGQSSTSGDCCSTFLFVFILFLPLVSFVALVPGKSIHYVTKLSISGVMVGICFLLCVWHAYSLYVLISNKKKWLSSWFTFNVSRQVLIPHSNQVGSRFFDIRKHLKYFDVTRDSLPKFPLLTKKQKQDIIMKFNLENMNRARIILYTSRFLESVHGFTHNVAVGMFLLSALCAGISIYELVYLLY